MLREKKGLEENSISEELQKLVVKNYSSNVTKAECYRAINWLYHSGIIGFCGKIIEMDILDFKPGRRCYFMDLGLAYYYLKRVGADAATGVGLLNENYVYINLLKRQDFSEEIAFETPAFATYGGPNGGRGGRDGNMDRLYTTGQSMGGMTSFHLNVAYPDLFAASLFVGSQWNNEILDVLEEDKFFYIVSAGDDKASTGQTGLMAVFDADGVPYTHQEWSAQEERDRQNASIEAMIAEGLNANFVTFTKGTTVAGGASGSEHLTSFDYAYKLEAVRDWLFAQSK